MGCAKIQIATSRRVWLYRIFVIIDMILNFLNWMAVNTSRGIWESLALDHVRSESVNPGFKTLDCQTYNEILGLETHLCYLLHFPIYPI